MWAALPINFDYSDGVTMSMLVELWRFLKSRKKLWLFPFVLVMLILGGLLIVAKGSVIAPFIYTLF
jgi:hypothetical protein